MINSYKCDIEIELNNAIYTLDVLPNHNWFVLNTIVRDHEKGKMGIYDLLLHKRDVSFSFKALLEWITISGIHFVDFDFYKIRYDLRTRYVQLDAVLKKTLARLDPNNNVFIMEIFK